VKGGAAKTETTSAENPYMPKIGGT
jgi:hypothetical protein